MDNPNDDRPLLMRAIDIAWPIMEADLATPDIMAALAEPDASTERVLAHAFLSALDRLNQKPKSAPALYRCGWCVHAEGDTDQAWQRAPSMDVAAMRDHTVACEHNPLVVRVRELEAGLVEACRYFDPYCGDSPIRSRLRALAAKGIAR